MINSWPSVKAKRDNSGDLVSRFFGLGIKRFLIIPFVMLLFVSSTCPVVAFDKKIFRKT